MKLQENYCLEIYYLIRWSGSRWDCSKKLSKLNVHGRLFMETLYITILIIEIFRFCFCRCPNFCSGHGKCEANSKCSCYDGWGSADDTSLYKSHDCSTRVCKYGPSWGNLPDIMNNAHGALLECSGIGICDRTIGLCKCPAGYEGGACERKVCINECSGKYMYI